MGSFQYEPVFLVGIPVQEVQVPLPALLGVSIDVRVVLFSALQVNPIHYASEPRNRRVLVSKRSQTHRRDWVFAPRIDQRRLHNLRWITPKALIVLI